MKSLEKKSSLTLLSEILKDPESKSIFRMTYDIFILTLYHKKFPKHYFSRFLFKKGITNIKDYYTDSFLYNKLKPFLNFRLYALITVLTGDM